MPRYVWIGLVALLVAGSIAYTVVSRLNTTLQPQNAEERTALRATVDAQNEEAFSRPARQALIPQPANPLKNAYFGDLHTHTSLSFDSYLFGNRLDPDAAYRIAKGESAEISTGERVELTRPLDFVALTDHAEGFGLHEACAQPQPSAAGRNYCADMESPSVKFFLSLRASGEERPMVKNLSIYNGSVEAERTLADSTWEKIKQAAERHYEPGRFTTFASYEYSPPLPDRGKHHRNVIFRSMDTPSHAVSAYDAASEIDLWKQLEATCVADCEFLTIPHNPNKTWGLAFASQTIDGVPYTLDDWALRQRAEPIVEMIQIKGNSECATAFGAGDEECGFEQFLPPCAEGQKTGCIFPTSMVRDGLQKGLALEDEIGVNPLQFGLIGSTDTHNSNPGDTEEWDSRGPAGFTSSPAARRLDGAGARSTGSLERNPGGLAVIWAPENTRDALFESMQRKEVYATSGTRITLRVFTGFELPADIAATGDIAAAYDTGVPMGGTLSSETAELALFVWAAKDPDSAPLAKLQVIKGWIQDGERQEVVYDIACGGSKLDPVTNQCADNGARVDTTNCNWPGDKGSMQIKTRWVDPDYAPEEDAFYYVRAIQNPTCRWSTYDSLRLGRELPKEVPASLTEMAWASPIWVKSLGE